MKKTAEMEAKQPAGQEKNKAHHQQAKDPRMEKQEPTPNHFLEKKEDHGADNRAYHRARTAEQYHDDGFKREQYV
ncbi:MAG: hypothetical protein HQ589_02155, partial [Syntrophaceae bacterium]|nr:hypothetical protein [Syntrophaceae bacterium]